MEGSEHVLAVRTSADTWVEITDLTGKQLEMDLMRGGSVRQYSGQPPFRVMIGRASAVELKMDDQLVDLGPHTRGLQATAASEEAEPDSGTEAEIERR